MLKNKLTGIAAFILAAVLMIPSAAFAAGTENGTQADPVQANSSDTATLYVGKYLTVSQDNKFPAITDFSFEITPVRAWDNANTSASASGAAIAAADMPMPAASGTSHHTVSASGTVTSVKIGDFTGEANTALADTATEKYRVTPVSITFTKAGYYMYRITESAGDTSPASVPGMAYDTNSYYAVIYVCNKTDAEGNTINGVYVHDITSYRNSDGTSYEPDTSDIHNTTDNGGTAATANDYTNMAKVGITPEEPGEDPETGNPTGPDKLEAFRFWNDQTTHDVVVTNNVTGNLGDITKEFEYTVTLTGLEAGKTYTTNVAAEDKTDVNTTSSTAEIEALASGGAGTVDSANKTFTADAGGNATFRIKLADDEVMVFNALPATSKYTVGELASDHVASFTSESTSEDWVMSLESKANTKNETALSTNEETVDAVSNVRNTADDNDGTVTIMFRNHRDIATVTGLPYYGDFAYALAALAAVAIALFIAGRRRGLNG